MEVLIAFQGGRKENGSLSQKRRMIERKQLKQPYCEYRWNQDQNETGGREHANDVLRFDR